MKKTRKLYGIYFLFVALLSLTPVVSSLLLLGKESYVSAIVSQSSLGLGAGKRGVVTVINPETGDREVVSERDYLCGVVASQMPADYDDEAIKAQAVVSYTLIKYRRIYGTPAETQSYITKKELKNSWGEDYSVNYSRLCQLVDSVYGEYIAYNGEPILAAYHDFSCGMTEDGNNIWNGDYPYLAATDSRDDVCAEDYRSTVSLSAEQFSGICRDKLGIAVKGEPSEWVVGCVRSDAGYVMSYTLCGSVVGGQRMRNVFGLRSACFTLKFEDKSFVFDVRGSGHGAGMSKFGANQMALDGKNYREIISHYYKDVKVIS